MVGPDLNQILTAFLRFRVWSLLGTIARTESEASYKHQDERLEHLAVILK